MKITTLNLQGFTNWQQRKSEILAYLTETKPDIILFQEVVFIPEISPFNQAQLLNQELRYPYEHSSVTRLQNSTEHTIFREGLAILSKHPLSKTETIVLKKDPADEHNRIVQLVDVLMDGQPVLLANVHFSITDNQDFATPQLIETLDTIDAKGEQRVIAGDFNLDHLEAMTNIWSDQYEASTQVPYISFPSWNKRNDYFLVPKNFVFEEITTSGDALSDHRAVTVKIGTTHK